MSTTSKIARPGKVCRSGSRILFALAKTAAPIKLAVLIGLVALSGQAPPVWAQTEPGGFERIEQFIQQTEDMLAKAAETVRSSESVRARQALQEAERLHHRSYELLMAGSPLLAYKTSQRARRAALHAAQIARDELGYEERVRVRLERLEELHAGVLERAQEAQDERALRFIQEAERRFQQAREQYVQHNYEVAFHLAESSESLLGRAARLLLESGGADGLERELERTAELIQRTAERLGDRPDPVARDMLQRAEQMLRQARQSLTRAQPLQTLRLTRGARRLAGQAASVAGRGPSAEAVSEQIARWDQRALLVAEQVKQADNKEAQLLLQRARQHRQKAQESLTAGDHELALRQIVFASDLLSEASELSR
jgi:hypothetical protein